MDRKKVVIIDDDNLAGQVITDVVQSYTGTEKKSVSKVDKTKAHNRDFYKRPKTVASAGGGGASSGAASNININVSDSVSYTNTTNVFSDMSSGAAAAVDKKNEKKGKEE